MNEVHDGLDLFQYFQAFIWRNDDIYGYSSSAPHFEDLQDCYKYVYDFCIKFSIVLIRLLYPLIFIRDRYLYPLSCSLIRYETNLPIKTFIKISQKTSGFFLLSIIQVKFWGVLFVILQHNSTSKPQFDLLLGDVGERHCFVSKFYSLTGDPNLQLHYIYACSFSVSVFDISLT